MTRIPAFDMSSSFARYMRGILSISGRIDITLAHNISLVADIRPKRTELTTERVFGSLPAPAYYITGDVKFLRGNIGIFDKMAVDELVFASGSLNGIGYKPPKVKLRYAFTNAEIADLVMKGVLGEDFDASPKALSTAGTYKVPVLATLAVVTSQDAKDAPLVFASIANAGCISINNKTLGVRLSDYFAKAPTATPDTIVYPTDVVVRNISSTYGFESVQQIATQESRWKISSHENILNEAEREDYDKRLEDVFEFPDLPEVETFVLTASVDALQPNMQVTEPDLGFLDFVTKTKNTSDEKEALTFGFETDETRIRSEVADKEQMVEQMASAKEEPVAFEVSDSADDVNDMLSRLADVWGAANNDESRDAEAKAQIVKSTKMSRQTTQQQTVQRMREEQESEDMSGIDAEDKNESTLDNKKDSDFSL